MSDKFSHHPKGSPSVPCRKHGTGRTITVTILEQESREPFAHKAIVQLQPPPGLATPTPQRTTPHGVATFSNLAAGRYTCSATHPGWSFVPEGERLTGADKLTLLAIEKDVKWGIDSNLGDASGTQILNLTTVRARKKTFICRYLSLDPQAHPPLSSAELALYKGFDIVPIWELTKRRAIEIGDPALEKQAGEDDAHAAVQQLIDANAPKGVTIYFTADFTVSRGDWLARDQHLIDAYFDGIGNVIHPSRIGAYGTYVPLNALLTSKRITWAWQMVFGKKGIKIDDRIHIYQYDIWPSTEGYGVAGAGALDLDCAVQQPFGSFRI